VKAGPGLPFGGVASGQGVPNGATGAAGADKLPPLLGQGSSDGSGGGGGSMFQGPRGAYSEPAQVKTTSAKPRLAPPPLNVALGNRDFVMTITCFSDHVTVYPGGKQHWWKNDVAATDRAVVKNVQDLIAGRQRSVQPGEPPYRPVIRFRLAPDGLAAYLHVYPRLTFLQVTMTRENLDD
jgi:hypothetical protein